MHLNDRGCIDFTVQLNRNLCSLCSLSWHRDCWEHITIDTVVMQPGPDTGEPSIAGVSWAAVAAGAIVSCALTVVLLAFGIGHPDSPHHPDPASASVRNHTGELQSSPH
jgi:hypothetical protein